MAQSNPLPSASVLDLKAALEQLPSSARLSNADTEAIYALAHSSVAQGRYETAYRYFSLLALYRPTNVTYLTGLARTYRLMERYEEALNVYSFLATIDPGEPEHTLAIAECLLLQRDLAEAQRTVEMVIRYCKENQVPEKVRSRAEAVSALMTGAAAA
jgi:type III secretion system low calcium response chaperone LcrH/SycD